MNEIFMNEELAFKDKEHGLHGHVQIFRTNKETKEKTLWYESDNIIEISGYQWILMKMFDLFMDSKHDGTETSLTKDTTIAIPDLNTKMGIGVKETDYQPITTNIPENHFIQGFMVGNGGAAENAINTKNTDYSYIKLVSPVPFQQATSLSNAVSYKYLGQSQTAIGSYYIKKFDSTPHIYHGWWVDGQPWDTTDPVTVDDLGPNSTNSPKTNRIETYCECDMSLDESDCIAYFNARNETPVLNELGLVAYNSKAGTYTTISNVYSYYIKSFIHDIFDNNIDNFTTTKATATSIYNGLKDLGLEAKDTKIANFLTLVNTFSALTTAPADYSEYQESLENDTTNIGVEGYYNRADELVYFTDNFMSIINSLNLGDEAYDEAERIKMITYYTFNSISLSDNYEITIKYRIYAN